MTLFIRELHKMAAIHCTCMVMEDLTSPSHHPSACHELCSWEISEESLLYPTWGVEGKSTFFVHFYKRPYTDLDRHPTLHVMEALCDDPTNGCEGDHPQECSCQAGQVPEFPFFLWTSHLLVKASCCTEAIWSDRIFLSIQTSLTGFVNPCNLF